MLAYNRNRMFSKAHHLVVQSKVTKNTFTSQSAITQLIEQLTPLAPKLKQFLGVDVFAECDFKEIKKICSRFPKAVERNKCVSNQLQIIKQLSLTLDAFHNQQDQKVKSYTPYLLWKHCQDIIINRIKAGLRGKSLLQLNNHPETQQLYLFTQAIQEATKNIEKWASKVKKMSPSLNKPNVEFVYPKSNTKQDNKTIRFTCDSTALASCKISKHDRISNMEDLHHFHTRNQSEDPNSYMLFRASTAKLERKELKMHTRCPSAAQLLKKSHFKKSSYEFRNSKIKTKHKSTDDFSAISKNYNNNLKKSSKIQQFLLLSREGGLLQNQSNQNQQNEMNVSILQTYFNEQQRGNSKDKYCHFQQDRMSIKLINDGDSQNDQQNHNNKSFESKVNIKNSLNSQNQFPSSIEIVRPEGRRTKVMYSKASNQSCSQDSKQLNNGQHFKSEVDESDSQVDIQAEELELKVKQRKRILKKSRRSGKYISYNQNTYENPNSSISKIKKELNSTNRSRRRIGMMGETQKLSDNQQQPVDGIPSLNKILQFDQNVLLAASDPNKRRKIRHVKSATHVDQPQKGTFNSIFAEMNCFLQKGQFNNQKQMGSVFFRQQQKLQEAEDGRIKERLKHVMRNKVNLYSNIFDMTYKTSLNKDVIYSQIHRKETFESDKEWIRNANCGSYCLQQKNI